MFSNLSKFVQSISELNVKIENVQKNIETTTYEQEKISNPEYKSKLIREEFLLSEEDEILFIIK